MSTEMPKCKITVLKRTINRDLVEEYLDDTYQDMEPCEHFEDNQEFVLERHEELFTVPEGFCVRAWADIRQDILTTALGADIPGFKRPGINIAGCTDWFRPVIFKVERMD
jgi:uncharacterized repeat protein (TIGR04076 family)